MKLGDIGEEMVATAIALAKERGAAVEALYVDQRAARAARSTRTLIDAEERAARLARGGARCSARTTASRCTATPCGRARSGTRSSRRRRRAARPDRARLLAALAAAERGSSRRRSTTCSQRALRGARRRVPAGRARGSKLIGCEGGRDRLRAGRAPPSRCSSHARAGTSTSIDEDEEALDAARHRLARRLRRRPRHGHRRAPPRRDRGGRRGRRLDRRRQHERRRSARSRRSATAIDCVVVRVLDPARADFYAKRGLRTVCPTQTAISVLTDIVRACDVRPLEPTGRRRGADVRDRRRRREGGRERRRARCSTWATR